MERREGATPNSYAIIDITIVHVVGSAPQIDIVITLLFFYIQYGFLKISFIRYVLMIRFNDTFFQDVFFLKKLKLNKDTGKQLARKTFCRD